MTIDASWVVFNRHFAPRNGLYGLVRLLTDQTLHLAVIFGAIILSGYTTPIGLSSTLVTEVQTHRLWAIALGYVLISLPAWIFLEFVLYGLINGSAPDFNRVRHYKYVGSLERSLIATFVATGQFMLVPVVALPRLVLESPQYFGNNRTTLYVAEWLGSLALAVLIGLALGHM
jgi:Na+/proline symporter